MPMLPAAYGATHHAQYPHDEADHEKYDSECREDRNSGKKAYYERDDS